MIEADEILAGDRRQAARLMTLAEAGDTSTIPVLQHLYRAGGHARIIGVTGPPGAGKSTLVDAIVARMRHSGKTVAVLAVDPTSPFSGGAVLGDRVRMAQHSEDNGVFIRSMATRGALGGLAAAAGDALTVLDAMRFDWLIIETVGVGQSEIDILNHAEAVILLQTALSGDALQTVKAGVLEIADIVVVNKASVAGSEKMANSLAQTIAERVRSDEAWMTPVLLTEASDGTGVTELLAALARFILHQAAHTATSERRARRRTHARVNAIMSARTSRAIARADQLRLDNWIDDVAHRRLDPYALADLLLSGRHG